MDDNTFIEFRLANGKRIALRAEQVRGMLGDETETELYVTTGEIKRAYTLAAGYDLIRERLQKAGATFTGDQG